MERKAYPSDVSDDEWAFVAPYLTLMTEDASQRVHSLREVFNDLRWIVRAGAVWAMWFSDPLLASAGLDRLSHRAHVIVITGASYRAKDRPLLTEKGGAIA